MAIKFTAEVRQRMSDQAKGKVVESLEWEPEEEYWVMTFTDGSELCFRTMAELAPRRSDHP